MVGRADVHRLVPVGQFGVGVPIAGIQILAVPGDTPLRVRRVVGALWRIALCDVTSAGEGEFRYSDFRFAQQKQ